MRYLSMFFIKVSYLNILSMEQKQSCLRDFDVISKLGEGAFGQVYKVKRKVDGKEYAMKKVDYD